jgi:hypothetical protein
MIEEKGRAWTKDCSKIFYIEIERPYKYRVRKAEGMELMFSPIVSSPWRPEEVADPTRPTIYRLIELDCKRRKYGATKFSCERKELRQWEEREAKDLDITKLSLVDDNTLIIGKLVMDLNNYAIENIIEK